MEMYQYERDPGPFEMYRADSGAIRFKVKFETGIGIANFVLCSKNTYKDIYRFTLTTRSRFMDFTKGGDQGKRVFMLPGPIGAEFQEYWLTWYNSIIRLGGEGNNVPFFEYTDDEITNNNIGFIKFHTTADRWPVIWFYETSPMIYNAKGQRFEDGKLRWEHMTDDHLPTDALIGGFEDEPIYIARSYHNGSYCPGKYVPSQKLAYIPWGHREHIKNDFVILCGYNAEWVKTKGNNIPPNAFIAGVSEVRNEPLYIGRAMHDGKLIVGKVHVIYKTCYLPYNGKEIEKYEFEILVSADVAPRGIMATEDNV